MFRFTIRDVLWLTVVVAFAALSYSRSADAKRIKQEKEDVEFKLTHAINDILRAWAKEKGSDVGADLGDHFVGAEPNGTVTLYGRAPETPTRPTVSPDEN